MVKCPRGTIPQMRANLGVTQRRSRFSLDESFFSWVYDPSKGHMVYVGEKKSQTGSYDSEEQELDSIIAAKRCPPTPRDDLIRFFVIYFLDIVLQSWEGKPCFRSKLPQHTQPGSGSEDNEKEGEDLGPCGSLESSAADSLRDLFQKRSSNLSRERSPLVTPKQKRSSTGSEYVNEEESESNASSSPWKFMPDEDVHFVLLNGVWYKGRVSGKVMEGAGVYFWEDGSTYEGEFVEGCVTGKGRLEFPDLSVYEGGVHKAFRHGEGMHCFSNSPVMYYGQWWLGKKHGHGLIVYDDPSKDVNFYRGQWQDGEKEGFGFRQYPSGAKYIGFWSKGKKHGKGVMFWNNGDIYRGQWNQSRMHGYGEYTWGGFVNKSLSYPATNTYRGLWSEGKRCGRGTLETKNGAFIETLWVDNMKEGPGIVLCSNGTLVAAESLFSRDKQALFSGQEDNIGLKMRDQGSEKKTIKNEEHLLAYIKSVERAKSIPIPIHSSIDSMNLSPHTQKYLLQMKEKVLKSLSVEDLDFQMIRPAAEAPGDSGADGGLSKNSLSDEDQCRLAQCMFQEEKHLRNFIVARILTLRACYNYYSTMACEKPPSSKCVLLRLFLWQLLIDSGVPRPDYSLVDIDCMLNAEDYLLIENGHDPFEQIQFWQFIHILIILSWHLYGRHIAGECPIVEDENVFLFRRFCQDSGSKNVLKAALQYFLDNVLPQDYNIQQNENEKLRESDLAPMEAMYAIYRRVGEPHTARDLMRAICLKKNSGREGPLIVEYFEKLPFYKIEGKNALTVAGELNHLPAAEPFNFPQIFQLEKKNSETERKSELTCFNGLKARGVLKCLIQVCPAIACQDLVVNMDYRLTFLEFYKVIVLCAELTMKLRIMKEERENVVREYKSQMVEYEKRVAEYEKLKENATASRKKSRQFSDLSKKGKK